MARGQKKHGPFAKQGLKGTPKARPSRGSGGMLPWENF